MSCGVVVAGGGPAGISVATVLGRAPAPGRCKSMGDRLETHEWSYNLWSTVSSLDSQTNSVVRMTLLGVFA
jgi:hypothetical protein